MGKLASLLGSTNRLYVVEQGERDARAKLAFVETSAMGWRSRYIDVCAGCSSQSTMPMATACTSAFAIERIGGFHPAGAMPVENGVALRDVDEAYVGGLTTLNWSPPDARGAEPWVDGVLALEASPVEDGAPT
jgi:hypothetical protein